MAYIRVNWEDAPSENTPLDAEHLNQMDEGIAKLDEEKLGKNGNAADVIATFEKSTNLQELSSGSKLSTLFGMIANAISSLISHLTDSVSHITSTERTNWNDANSKKHTHSNKTTLDAITAAYTSDEKSKLSGIAEGANAYTHPNSGVTAGTYRNVTVNAQGHVTGGSNPTVTVAQGGTGATTVAAARNALGLGNTSGALPVANGGTGATDAATARTNLGVAYGTAAGTVCQGNDSRLSNARTPTSHNQAASTITAGTLAGKVLANASAVATVTDKQVRNIYAGITDMTAGTTALPSGDIYVFYE